MEIWKDIVGYEGLYQISNIGNLKSMNFNNSKYEKVLGYFINTQGYKIFQISYLGKKYKLRAHRLVAKAFIPNPKNNIEVNHINGIKTDNKLENLEWCTRSDNMKHAYKNGLRVNAIADLIIRNKTLPRINGKISKLG